MDSELIETPEVSRPAWNVFNGGRALNAIWSNPEFSSYERLVLVYLGSQMDFNKNFSEQRWESYRTLQEKTALSRSTLIRVINELAARGYLKKVSRSSEGKKNSLSNLISFTRKMFVEHERFLTEKHASKKGVSTEQKPDKYTCSQRTDPMSTENTGTGSQRTDPMSTVKPELPQKKLPQKETPSTDIHKNSATLLAAMPPASPQRKVSLSENDFVLAERWRNEHLAVTNPNKLREGKSHVACLAESFRQVRVRKKFDDEMMTRMVDTVFEDNFWRSVLVMPSGFLNKKAGADTDNADHIFKLAVKPITNQLLEQQANEKAKEICANRGGLPF